MTPWFIVFAVCVGALLPIQGVLNGQLGRALDSAILAALISFAFWYADSICRIYDSK